MGSRPVTCLILHNDKINTMGEWVVNFKILIYIDSLTIFQHAVFMFTPYFTYSFLIMHLTEVALSFC